MKLFENFKNRAIKKVNDFNNPKEKTNKNLNDHNKIKKQEFTDFDNLEEDYSSENLNDNNNDYNDNYDDLDGYNLQPGQKPESFHFFILENQFRDIERMVRGVKDVWDKESQSWKIKRKKIHCFTDEESEEILRTAQSHLSTDIKLATFTQDEYNILLTSIYEQLESLFLSFSEYRFGRFGDVTKQYNMKLMSTNIFQVIMYRIKANYSRAVGGKENIATHQSVKGQESLNQTNKKEYDSNSYT